MRPQQLAVAMLATMLVVGCRDQSVWLRRGLVDPLDAQRLGYRSLWRTDLGLSGDAKLTTAQSLGDLIVLTEFPRNLVTALDAATGNVRWTAGVGERGKLLFTPRRIEDRIIVNNETTLYVLDAETGVVRQANKLQAVVSSAPAVRGPIAYFAGINGRLFAHNIASGQLVWAYQMPASMDAPPSVSGSVVVAADRAGNYRAVSAETGAQLWQGRAFGRISARLAATPLGVFVASEDTHLYALDLETGRQRWQFLGQSPLQVGPLVLGQTVYQGVGGRSLTALEATTGRTLWTMEEAAIPIVQRGQWLIVYASPKLMLVESATGLPRAVAVAGALRAVIPGPQQSLILIGERGRLERLDPQP